MCWMAPLVRRAAPTIACRGRMLDWCMALPLRVAMRHPSCRPAQFCRLDSTPFLAFPSQMLSGERAWAGRHSAQILYAITTQHQKLHAPAGYPAELRVSSDSNDMRCLFCAVQQALFVLHSTA